MIATVAQYNATIAQEAADRDWVFLDPNPLLVQLAADPSAVRHRDQPRRHSCECRQPSARG